MKEYQDKIYRYLKTHKYGEWSKLMKLLDNPNPNTLSFSLKKLRDEGKIERFESWKIKK